MTQQKPMPNRTPITEQPFKLALFLMPFGIPLALWGAWDSIQAAPSPLLKVVLGLGVVFGTYLGAGALLWFNRYMQNKWRKHNVI